VTEGGITGSRFSGIIGRPGAPRILALSKLASSIGDGLYYVCAALFFTRVVGLSPAQIGLGLTIAWTVGFIASVPLGHVADQRGPRGVAVTLLVLAGAATAAYLVIASLSLFIVAASVYAVCSRGSSAAQLALLAGSVDQTEVTRSRAFMISMLNAGLAAGAGLASIVLLFDTEAAYRMAFAANALSFVVAALLLSRIPAPRLATDDHSPSSVLEVLKDGPFVAVTAINAVLVLHLTLIDVALPLFILQHTEAPLWVVSGVFVLNTTMVVLYQVRVSRGVTGLFDATRFLRYAGVLLLAGCAAYAASALGSSSWLAAVVLLVATAIMTVGEMCQTVATTEISFGLSPEGRHGQYQAFFGLGLTAAEAAGPLLLTGLIVYGSWQGWLVLGGLFLLASLAMAPAVRWGKSARARAGAVWLADSYVPSKKVGD
jgi:MFS family permease